MIIFKEVYTTIKLNKLTNIFKVSFFLFIISCKKGAKLTRSLKQLLLPKILLYVYFISYIFIYHGIKILRQL